MGFAEKIGSREAVVGVVGLGYVGLPLLINFAASGRRVIGFDIDESKVRRLQAGESYIKHIDAGPIKRAAEGGLLRATTDFSEVASCDALVICVPTPLSQHHEPDLSYVTSTLDSVVPHLRAGQLLSLESTTYPGTTAEEVVPRVEQRGLSVGEDVFVVYSPEREDPGNPDFHSTDIPKVVGGATAACLDAGRALYSVVYEKVVPVSSTQVAEFTKLLENIYRAVNIGLVNELKIVADEMGIDIWEVIRAASSKPFGYTPFYPGPGLGGHCIPIDPFYLTWKAKEYGIHTRFIELAGEVNREMPAYVVKRVAGALNDVRKPVKGSKVLILGLAYKPDVDDTRESPSFALMNLLDEMGAELSFYDPHIAAIPPTRSHSRWAGLESVAWSKEVIGGMDCVVLVTNHRAIDTGELVEWARLIVDTRNGLDGVPPGDCVIVKA